MTDREELGDLETAPDDKGFLSLLIFHVLSATLYLVVLFLVNVGPIVLQLLTNLFESFFDFSGFEFVSSNYNQVN